jgi:hypothetical protein
MTGGGLLLAIAALMLLGFFRSDAAFADPATIAALLFTVGASAGGGAGCL